MWLGGGRFIKGGVLLAIGEFRSLQCWAECGAANNNVATSIPTFIFIIYTPTTKDMNHGKYFTGRTGASKGEIRKVM
ncbi:hypothetical protein PCI56_17420 [Plesiomonas shigelloides subsp. oncorhynchi]|nr:hypothetical protein [Plesiomonas shigelloides]